MQVIFWLFAVVCSYHDGTNAEPVSATYQQRDNTGIYQWRWVDTLTTRWDTISFSAPTQKTTVSTEVQLSAWVDSPQIDTVRFFANGSLVFERVLTTSEQTFRLSFLPIPATTQNRIDVVYKVASGSVGGVKEHIFLRPLWVLQ